MIALFAYLLLGVVVLAAARHGGYRGTWQKDLYVVVAWPPVLALGVWKAFRD